MFAHFIALTEQGTAESLSLVLDVLAKIASFSGYFRYANELVFSQFDFTLLIGSGSSIVLHRTIIKIIIVYKSDEALTLLSEKDKRNVRGRYSIFVLFFVRVVGCLLLSEL